MRKTIAELEQEELNRIRAEKQRKEEAKRAEQHALFEQAERERSAKIAQEEKKRLEERQHSAAKEESKKAELNRLEQAQRDYGAQIQAEQKHRDRQSAVASSSAVPTIAERTARLEQEEKARQSNTERLIANRNNRVKKELAHVNVSSLRDLFNKAMEDRKAMRPEVFAQNKIKNLDLFRQHMVAKLSQPKSVSPIEAQIPEAVMDYLFELGEGAVHPTLVIQRAAEELIHKVNTRGNIPPAPTALAGHELTAQNLNELTQNIEVWSVFELSMTTLEWLFKLHSEEALQILNEDSLTPWKDLIKLLVSMSAPKGDSKVVDILKAGVGNQILASEKQSLVDIFYDERMDDEQRFTRLSSSLGKTPEDEALKQAIECLLTFARHQDIGLVQVINAIKGFYPLILTEIVDHQSVPLPPKASAPPLLKREDSREFQRQRMAPPPATVSDKASVSPMIQRGFHAVAPVIPIAQPDNDAERMAIECLLLQIIENHQSDVSSANAAHEQLKSLLLEDQNLFIAVRLCHPRSMSEENRAWLTALSPRVKLCCDLLAAIQDIFDDKWGKAMHDTPEYIKLARTIANIDNKLFYNLPTMCHGTPKTSLIEYDGKGFNFVSCGTLMGLLQSTLNPLQEPALANLDRLLVAVADSDSPDLETCSALVLSSSREFNL